MKRILNVFLLILITIAAAAQTDVVSVEEAIGIYNNGKLANAKTVLEKQGYRYKGVSNLAGRDYCWAKNVELTKDFIPQSYGVATPAFSFSPPTVRRHFSMSITRRPSRTESAGAQPRIQHAYRERRLHNLHARQAAHHHLHAAADALPFLYDDY